MKRLAIIAVLVAGCGPAVPTADEIQPFIAVAGTYSVMASSTTAPPAPVQGDVCPACYGRGIVGDQKNMVKCQTCNGTGKLTTATPECKDGKCQMKPAIAR